MSPEVPSIKLPNSPFGYFLLLHTGLLFFWLYNRLDSAISILLPISISGILVGWVMQYLVGGYLEFKWEEENKNSSEKFSSAISYWIVAIVAYIILFLIISYLMQPVTQSPWMKY